MADQIQSIKVLDAVVIAASGSSTTVAMPTSVVAGYFSLQYAVTGDGTCKFEVLCSLDDTTYIDCTEVADIVTGVTKTSGNGSDGKNIHTVTIPPSSSFKIKCTETGGANSVTITAYVGVQ